ncbi:hypothetical protein [Bacillus sp. RO1]|uniref:hypothetical protein n=1 Tax=Bacillus sp. RO1 TaxID=2722703 RepID=UPI001456F481|nr:hypothetical protein [Bacillus sp. RO1]NLP51285.1 hypothetical protein [Bacillus sp. RO1]
MNRGQLLSLAYEGKVKEGDKFVCSKTGRKVIYDGNGFKHVNKIKEENTGYMWLVKTKNEESWTKHKEATKRTFELDEEVVEKLEELLNTSGLTTKAKKKELENKIVNKGILYILEKLAEEENKQTKGGQK